MFSPVKVAALPPPNKMADDVKKQPDESYDLNVYSLLQLRSGDTRHEFEGRISKYESKFLLMNWKAGDLAGTERGKVTEKTIPFKKVKAPMCPQQNCWM